MSGVFIVAAKRTPFGAFGGLLKNVSATQLGVVSTKAAIAQANNLDPSAIDGCFFGNVIQSSPDAAYLSRHVALQSGCSISTPALTINRLCGSGFESVIQAVKSIKLQEYSIVIAGGTENMSMAPLVAEGHLSRWGTGLGQGLKLRDALWDGLTDSHAKTPMGMTAENLAKLHGITRKECDEFAVLSQSRWAEAHKAGMFDREMAPVEIPGKKGSVKVDTDEHPRPESTTDKIAKLKPVFSEDGVVTAANASGICDGAGTILVASEQACQQHNLTPLARVVSYGVTACDPKIMGIGPVEAIRMALQRAGGLDLAKDVDLVEINEAFAAQFLACAKELGLDKMMDKANVHGGAISLGHPLAASGSRITAHLVHQFAHKPTNRIHVGAACIGGGQGIAVVLERA